MLYIGEVGVPESDAGLPQFLTVLCKALFRLREDWRARPSGSRSGVAADLTDASVRRDVEFVRRPRVLSEAWRRPLNELRIAACPCHVVGADVHIQAQLEDVGFSAYMDRENSCFVDGVTVGGGEATVRIPRGELQKLVKALVVDGIGDDARVDRVGLQIQQDGERNLCIQVRVDFSKVIIVRLRGTFRVEARMEISRDLILRLQDFTCAGDNMLGRKAAPVVTRKLQSIRRDGVRLLDQLQVTGAAQDARLSLDDRELTLNVRFRSRSSR
jgi:hypothetical protein